MINNKICRYSKKCNGCQLQNMNYSEQLVFKQKKINYLFANQVKPNPIIPMDNPYHYRNKSQFAFRQMRDKSVVSGIYQSKTRSVFQVDKCLLDKPIADKIAQTMCKLAKSFKLSIYDYHRMNGFLRHILVRTSCDNSEIMVVIVASNALFPAKKKFVNALLKCHPEITTVVFNVSESDKLMLGNREEVLFGKGYIIDMLMGRKFRISSSSFYQVNHAGTELLYSKAIELADFKGNEILLDTYCGIGTIGIAASDKVGTVIGVEVNSSAIRDARQNAKLNCVENAEFYCNDAGLFMEDMAEHNEKVDVVIMDPPRLGSDETFLKSLVKLNPKKVIYISCNPETLRRDAEYLTKNGYRIMEVQAVDLFPMTNHVEVVIMMIRCGDKVEK